MRDITITDTTLTQEAEQLNEMTVNRGDPNVKKINELVKEINEFAEQFPKQTEGADDRLEWLVHVLDQVEMYRYVVSRL